MWRGDPAYLSEFPPVPPTKGAKPLSQCGGHKPAESEQCQDRDKPCKFSGAVLGALSPAFTIRTPLRDEEPKWTWEQVERWLDHCDAIFGITRDPDPFAHLEWPRPPKK